MGRYTSLMVIGVIALAAAGILAYNLLEIYGYTEALPPSPEARANEYLALDRWLRGAGRPVRLETQGTPGMIREAPEPVIFIQASRFVWPGDAWAQMEPWVEKGGSLIISLDTPWYERKVEGLNSLLAALNISSEDQIPAEHPFSPRGPEPNFDPLVAFSLPEPPGESPETFSENFFILTDHQGVIRLVQTGRGRGLVTVLGKPDFLTSTSLNREPNALLAWSLLAAAPGGAEREDNPGVLFIRGEKPVRDLFGRIMDRGNIRPLMVSALVLIIAGFWTVIPLFGVLAREDEKPGRPLRERFLAEGRFLQKYRALDSYRAAYIREIFRRLRQKENLDNEAALDRRFLELWARASQRGAASHRETVPTAPLGRRNFVKTVETLQTILERL